MTDQDQGFTAQEAAAATTALRAALDLPPERFGLERFVGMISNEIEQLRDAGLSDDAIAGLLREKAGLDVPAEAIGRHYASPERRAR